MGVPLVAGMFIMVLYNLVDTWFIGRLGDDYQLAAVNLAYPVMMIMIAISNMIGTGAGSLIARSLGSADEDKANHTLTSAFVLTLVNAAILAALGFIFLKPLVSGLGARQNTYAYTTDYVAILLAGSLFVMGNYTFGQLLRSEGSVSYSVLGMILGTLANILLDPLFIFVFGMEIRGAALATVLGNGVGMAASLYYYISHKSLLSPGRKYIRPTLEILREIFWVGVPATMETSLTTVAYVVNNNLAVAYGELTVAAMGIAQKILSLGTYIYQGFASGNQPLMGYNYGAGNYRRMLDILKAGVAVVTSTEFVLMAVYGIFAPFWLGFFTKSAEVISVGSHVLRTIMWILPFVGSVSMSRISFQAMGKPQYAFAITLVRQMILYVPLLLILDRCFGFDGMIWAQPITEAIMMAVSLFLLSHNIRSEENSIH